MLRLSVECPLHTRDPRGASGLSRPQSKQASRPLCSPQTARFDRQPLPDPPAAPMTPLQGHLAKLGLGLSLLSGLALFWMRSLLAEPSDPLALANHPQEPLALATHVAASWLAVFAVGSLFWGHALAYLAAGQLQRRRSGQVLVWSFVPMALSGVGLQVLVHDAWRNLALWTHWVTGLLFGCALVAHLLGPKLLRR